MFPNTKRKLKTLGGVEYQILGSTTEMEGGRVVHQSYKVFGGRVIVEADKVIHPNGNITDHSGKSLRTKIKMDDTPRQRIMQYLAEKHSRGVTDVSIAEVADYAYPNPISRNRHTGKSGGGPAVSGILRRTGAATKVEKKVWKIIPSNIDPTQTTLPGI